MGLTSPNKTQVLLLLPTTTLLLILISLSSAAMAAKVVSKDGNPTMDSLLAAVTPTPHGWSSATHFCNWRGVECDTKNRVISLTLPSQSLSGVLPSSLNSLSHLTTLSLQNNHFSGPLPSFANLSRLRKLYLHNNSFTSIPTGAFSGLINLQILSLSNNGDLSPWRFPSELSDSPKMVALHASNANIMGSIPDIFRGFTRLVNLTLSYNNLSGYLPSSFSGSVIQILKLDNQKSGLSGSIDILSGMHNLSVLWLNGNKFSGVVPPSLVSLPNLSDVRLERNNFIGLIPAISKFSKDVVVNLGTISSRNDYVVGSFSCRRCKVFIRADVRNVGVAPPTEDSSSGNKTNVGEVVGLSFLLVFVILVIFVCICWNRRSATARERGVHRQQAVVQGGERIEENPQQVEIVRPLPPPPLREGVLGRREGEQSQPPPPAPPRDGVPGRQEEQQPQPQPQPPLPRAPWDEIIRPKKEKPTQPPPPPRDGILGKEEIQPKPQQPPLSRAPRDEIIRPRKEKQAQPHVPPRDGVPGRRKGKQPQPPPLRDEVQRRKEGKQEQQQPPEDEERRRKRVREGKQPQQQSEPQDEEVERQVKRGKDGNQTHQVAKEHENSLGLPNKYTYENLMIMTNDFDQENKIGEGSYGNVYKGILSDGTTMVAVKCLKFGAGKKDFDNEVAALGQTDHPNLVKLIGYCNDSVLRILVYEYMINGSLEKWIFRGERRRSLTWPVIKNIIQGIAKGLVHLHDECDMKILHRDLKPSNVVLDENKNAKLCDFGLAKLLDKDKNSTSTGYAGTPAYMAPEAEEVKRISDKIDVYSFGIVVLEVLFGRQYCSLVKRGHERVEETRLPYLINNILSVKMRKHSKEVEKIGKLAVSCIHEKPEDRPRMCDVLKEMKRSHEPEA